MLMWESYLDTAAEFVRLAGRVPDPALKLKLVDMAWLWLQIADQAEKEQPSRSCSSPGARPPPITYAGMS
jgi:hypothetical protein